MQEIRDRLTTLETKHEERHYQTQETLSRIATAVESIADNQSKMSHLGSKVDSVSEVVKSDHDRLNAVELKQGIMWKAIGAIGTAITGVIVAAAFKMWGG